MKTAETISATTTQARLAHASRAPIFKPWTIVTTAALHLPALMIVWRDALVSHQTTSPTALTRVSAEPPSSGTFFPPQPPVESLNLLNCLVLLYLPHLLPLRPSPRTLGERHQPVSTWIGWTWGGLPRLRSHLPTGRRRVCRAHTWYCHYPNPPTHPHTCTHRAPPTLNTHTAHWLAQPHEHPRVTPNHPKRPTTFSNPSSSPSVRGSLLSPCLSPRLLPVCTAQAGCAIPGTPCLNVSGYTTKKTCTLAANKFYLPVNGNGM